MATNNPIKHGSKFKDLTGQVFNLLTVESFSGKDKYRNSVWNCQCKCGNSKQVTSYNLKRGHVKSCGCIWATHRSSKTKTYKRWMGMIIRCYNPRSKSYKDYGGRGITVCDEWRHDYLAFLRDMGECPEDLSLERIDNEAPYSKENCRWATKLEQANNTRTNRFLTHNGKTLTYAQWARELGIGTRTFWARLKRDRSPFY